MKSSVMRSKPNILNFLRPDFCIAQSLFTYLRKRDIEVCLSKLSVFDIGPHSATRWLPQHPAFLLHSSEDGGPG